MHTCAWLLAAATFLDYPGAEPPAVSALIATLRDSDVETRIHAGTALAALGSPVVDSLITSLQDSDRNARSGAAYALGQLGIAASPAKPQLVILLRDEDKDVRRQAAYALSRLLHAEQGRVIVSPIPPEPVFPPEQGK